MPPAGTISDSISASAASLKREQTEKVVISQTSRPEEHAVTEGRVRVMMEGHVLLFTGTVPYDIMTAPELVHVKYKKRRGTSL